MDKVAKNLPLQEQARLMTEEVAYLVETDCCPACHGPLPEEPKLVLIRLPILITKDGKPLPYCGICLCDKCREEQDYNKIKRGLAYLEMECIPRMKDSA